LLVLLVLAGVARYRSVSARWRNAWSVVLVVLALVTVFFLFFAAGSSLRGHRSQPRPHASASQSFLAAAFNPALETHLVSSAA